MKCPQCGIGDVGEKRTRRGKPFWGCTRYPECDWSTWDEPVARACPDCAAPFLVRKTTKARGEFLRCLTCAHEYTLNADGALDPAGIGRIERRTQRTAAGNGRTPPKKASTTSRKKKVTARAAAAKTTPRKTAAPKKAEAKRAAAKRAPAKSEEE
jgi:hypothetical protein